MLCKCIIVHVIPNRFFPRTSTIGGVLQLHIAAKIDVVVKKIIYWLKQEQQEQLNFKTRHKVKTFAFCSLQTQVLCHPHCQLDPLQPKCLGTRPVEELLECLSHDAVCLISRHGQPSEDSRVPAAACCDKCKDIRFLNPLIICCVSHSSGCCWCLLAVPHLQSEVCRKNMCQYDQHILEGWGREARNKTSKRELA